MKLHRTLYGPKYVSNPANVTVCFWCTKTVHFWQKKIRYIRPIDFATQKPRWVYYIHTKCILESGDKKHCTKCQKRIWFWQKKVFARLPSVLFASPTGKSDHTEWFHIECFKRTWYYKFQKRLQDGWTQYRKKEAVK